MKILWISSIAWKCKGEYPYPVNGAGAVSGSLFQQSMIEGLEKLGHSVDIISDYPYAPGYNISTQIEWKHNDNSSDILVKTINIPYYSILYKSGSLKRAVKQKIKESSYDVAIAYLIHQPYMEAIAYAKRMAPNLKTVLICPDLPDMMDMSLSQKKIKSFLKKIDKKRIERLYGEIDGFVLFAEPMLEKINVGLSKYTTIEGVASVDDLDTSYVNKERFVMYAGTLHRNIGIENIIDAMNYVEDKSLKLKIYGSGELEEYIKNKAESNPNIIFGGFIDRNGLFEEQKRATALINARNANDEYTKYSFPSKTFEYLYSGTPFITTFLAGIPQEYKKHFFVIEDNTPQTIAEKINKVCMLDEKSILMSGCEARDFIIKMKTAKCQSKKMEEFLISLL